MTKKQTRVKWPLASKPLDKSRSVEFDSERIGMIFGLLLGDGTLRKARYGKSRLWITQSTKHKHFMQFIQHYLSKKHLMYEENLDNCARLNYRLHEKANLTYDYVRWTFSFTELAHYRKLWYILHTDYKQERKTVPMELYEYLTPLCLAMWICCDGSSKGNGLYLHVQGFSIQCIRRLQAFLYMKFRIQTTTQHKGRNLILYVRVQSMGPLKEIVYGYLHECHMLYKINPSIVAPKSKRPVMTLECIEANLSLLKNNPKKLLEKKVLQEFDWLEKKLQKMTLCYNHSNIEKTL